MNIESRQLICIVDDEVVNAKILSYILGRQYRTVVAHSGTEALEVIREEKPDLVILDIMMPGMDGLDVCDQLKGDPKTADIPIVFVTGLEHSGDQEKGFEAGAADYITKPIYPNVVRARIGRILEHNLYLSLLENLVAQKSQSIEELRASIASFLAR